ncbi:MAG: hypothetical protein QMD82_04725 [bacterium]|nr:hypothetical protein [bacterium]
MGKGIFILMLTVIPRVFSPDGTGKKLSIVLEIPDTIREKITTLNLVRECSEGKLDTLNILPFLKTYTDNELDHKKDYRYKILAYSNGNLIFESEWSEYARPTAKWFDKDKFPLFIAMILFTIIMIYYIAQARANKPLYLRPIAGLEAVNDAIGRATEMGRPIIYINGLSNISDIATIAALNILSHVTKRAGEFETRIIVPCYDPVVYTIAREIVKEAYTTIGRPDLFNPDDVYFATDSQFGYAAHVAARMVREQSATNFFMGYYFAESLILSETGASTGAIQVAGTDAIAQLPFFVVTCDYTLIGEELYAASAYLSREPLLTGTIKAQDLAKLLLSIVIIMLSVLNLFGINITLGLF